MNRAMKPNSSIIIRFFEFIFQLVKTYFLFIGFLVTVAPMLLIYLAHQKEQSEPSLGSQLVLDMRLDQVVTESTSSGSDIFYREFFGGEDQLSLTDFEKAVTQAAQDDRIKAVYIEIANPQATSVQYVAMRRALALIKKAQKPLYIHLSNPDFGDYYLASIGDVISLAPSETLFLTGPVLQLAYFKGLLQHLGLEFEVVRAGKYKSAMEPLVADHPSAATWEMYRSLESHLLGFFSEQIAQDRKVSQDQVKKWFQVSLHDAAEAQQLKIIDKLAYQPESHEDFISKFKDSDPINLADYLNASKGKDQSKLDQTGPELGLIEARGTIMMSRDSSDRGSVVTPQDIIEQIDYMADRDQVKAVVLRIDSPGGSALASDMIWHRLSQLAAQKPVVVSMGAVAASGGYYIAAPAQKIIAEPTTITGSIGVIAGMPNGKSLSEKWGVSFYLVTSTDRKNLLDPTQPLSEDDKRLFGASIDLFYANFLKVVSEGRHQSIEEIHEKAQGRVYTGQEALALGLVDQLGGIKQAFEEAKRLAKLDLEKLYPVGIHKPKPKSILDCLDDDWSETFQCLQDLDSKTLVSLGPRQPNLTSLSLPISAQDVKLYSRLRLWKRLFEQSPIQLLMPLAQEDLGF